MKPMTKAVVVALVQILLISSLGAKLLIERRRYPQAWFQTRRYDPNLPIRGRYLNLQIEVKDSRTAAEIESKFAAEIKDQNLRKTVPGQPQLFLFGRECGSIEVRDGVPVAVFARETRYPCENLAFTRSGATVWSATLCGWKTRFSFSFPTQRKIHHD